MSMLVCVVDVWWCECFIGGFMLFVFVSGMMISMV